MIGWVLEKTSVFIANKILNTSVQLDVVGQPLRRQIEVCGQPRQKLERPLLGTGGSFL
jgi:hypothetical protein